MTRTGSGRRSALIIVARIDPVLHQPPLSGVGFVRQSRLKPRHIEADVPASNDPVEPDLLLT